MRCWGPCLVGLLDEVLVVEPCCLDVVELGTILRALAEVEELYHLLEAHHLLIVAWIPAEESEEVDDSFWQVAALAIAAV